MCVFAICRLKTTFVDDTRYVRSGIATGMWVLSNEKKIFVTNKHSLDLSMKYKENTCKLIKIEIELREKSGNNFSPECSIKCTYGDEISRNR